MDTAMDESVDSEEEFIEQDEIEQGDGGAPDENFWSNQESGPGFPVFRIGDGLRPPRFRPLDPVLPATVSMMENPATGGRVYLVGTAHFGTESQEDVATTIRMLGPDFCVLELCPERKSILTMDENAQQVNPTWHDLNDMIKRMGASQAVLQFCLLKLSAHCTEKLGMVPGGEMRCAYREACKLQNCLVLLGDRPISITLKRAFGSLSFWQKLHFLYVLTREMGTDISQEDVEKCKNSDVLEELIEKLSLEFPVLHRVLLSERDIFLASVLKSSTAEMIETSAGPQPSVVVGVVGIGHVAGIKRAWASDLATPDQLAELLVIPQPSKVQKYVTKLALLSTLGLMGFGVYKLGSMIVRRIR